jgi:tight adherence protein B
MLNPLILASGAFVTILLLGIGLFRSGNQGAMLVRRRLSAFAPAPTTVASATFIDGPVLLGPKSYSSIGIFEWLLKKGDIGTRLSIELARAGLALRVSEYLLARCLVAGTGAIAVRVVTGSMVLGVVIGIVGYFLPVLYVRRKKDARLRKFDDQVVDALVLMANALKSGYSFMQGMETIAREMPDPIGTEFAEALHEIRMGGSAEEALVSMSARVRSAEFELVVTAMVIQRQVGGNLTEILNGIAHTVRERHRILREVRVLTAQERMSGYIIAAMPAFLVVMLSLIHPGYIGGMWQEFFGKILLVVGFVMALLGLLVIRKLVDIDV